MDRQIPAVEPEDAERVELTACGHCSMMLPASVRVCPRCGRGIANTRRITLAIGTVGLLAIAFVLVLMLKTVRDWDLEHRTEPAPVEQQTTERPLGN